MPRQERCGRGLGVGEAIVVDLGAVNDLMTKLKMVQAGNCTGTTVDACGRRSCVDAGPGRGATITLTLPAGTRAFTLGTLARGPQALWRRWQPVLLARVELERVHRSCALRAHAGAVVEPTPWLG